MNLCQVVYFLFSTSSHVKPRLGLLWGLASVLLATTTLGQSQELAWVRQIGSAGDDSVIAIAEDSDANVYLVGNYAGKMTLGSLALEDPGSAAYVAKMNSRGEVEWANAITSSFSIQPTGLAIDPAGFLYVTGCFDRTAEFGATHLGTLAPGYPDVFLAKYDLKGGLLWAKRYGGNSGTRASGVVVGRMGSVFLCGGYGPSTTLGDFFLPGGGPVQLWVAGLDGSGEVQWARAAGTMTGLTTLPKLAIDPGDNLFAAGGFVDAMSFPQGAYASVTNTVCTTNQVLVAQTDWLTNVLCLTNFNVDPIEVTCSNVLTAQTSYVLSNSVGCVTVPALSNLNGSFDLEGLPGGQSAMFLAKYDSGGKCLWARGGGGTATDLAVATNGEVYVTGTMQYPNFGKPYYSAIFDGIEITGKNDCFLAKFDSSGGLVWAINEGGSSVALGPDGDVYATSTLGSTRTFAGRTFTASGYQDIFVSRYDSAGNGRSAWQIGDMQGEMAGDIAVDRSGTIMVAGFTYHGSAANNYQQANYGGWDVMVAKLSSQGPAIIRQPERATIRQGDDASFRIEVTNAISARFEWLKNGNPLADTSKISGSHEPVLRIRAAETADEADYSVRVTADNGQILSSIARLRVEGLMQFTKSEKGQYGEFLVSFSGVSGHLYDIEISTDCRNWVLLTNGVCFQGTLTVSDFSRTYSTQRFYRAVAH